MKTCKRNRYNGVISRTLGKNERLGTMPFIPANRWEDSIKNAYEKVFIMNRSGMVVAEHWVGKIHLN